MRTEKSPEEMEVIRHKCEYTDQPLEEIARDHGRSARTLNSWARRWNWKRRRAPLPAEGPPPSPPPPQIERAPAPLRLAAPQGPPPAPAPAAPVSDAASLVPAMPDTAPPLPIAPDTAPPGAELPGDPDTPTALRLQGAVASVLAAIEALVAKIGGARLGESDRSARALAALTRTLRELNTLQGQYEEPATDDDSPADIDEFRDALARKIDALVAARDGGARDGAEPQGA